MTPTENTALEIYRAQELDEVYLIYKGFISDELTNTFLDISENTVVDNLGLTKINRKASFLLVECFQNMLKHTHSEDEDRREHQDALFHFHFNDNYFRINSVNTIRKEEEQLLSDQVDEINRLDKASLKDLYKNRLVQNELSSKGGAGLGLIEMARKSGQQLRYAFSEIDKEHSAFMQQITMAGEGYDNAVDNLKDLEGIRDFVDRDEVILVYKGDLSQKAILPLILLLEKNSNSNDDVLTKRAGITMIEMLQNASKHGLNRGVLKIFRRNGNLIIEVGNSVKPEEGKALQYRMQVLSRMTPEQLKHAYQSHLRNVRNLGDSSNSGLGLMEIARLSNGKFEFDLESQEESSFFTMRVEL